MDKLECILPEQFVGKYKNDDGVILFPVIFIDENAMEIVKIFIPKDDYKTLKIKRFLGRRVTIEIDEDDDGRKVVKSIESLD